MTLGNLGRFTGSKIAKEYFRHIGDSMRFAWEGATSKPAPLGRWLSRTIAVHVFRRVARNYWYTNKVKVDRHGIHSSEDSQVLNLMYQACQSRAMVKLGCVTWLYKERKAPPAKSNSSPSVTPVCRRVSSTLLFHFWSS